jgi:hypothetical protein
MFFLHILIWISIYKIGMHVGEARIISKIEKKLQELQCISAAVILKNICHLIKNKR